MKIRFSNLPAPIAAHRARLSREAIAVLENDTGSILDEADRFLIAIPRLKGADLLRAVEALDFDDRAHAERSFRRYFAPGELGIEEMLDYLYCYVLHDVFLERIGRQIQDYGFACKAWIKDAQAHGENGRRVQAVALELDAANRANPSMTEDEFLEHTRKRNARKGAA